MRYLTWLALFVFGVAVGLAIGRDRWNISGEVYQNVRGNMMVAQLAEQYGRADAVVFGDSLTEMAYVEGACGKTFNAGVGFGKVETFGVLAREVLSHTNPATVVIALGTNNRDDAETFASSYPALVSQMPGRRILVGVAISDEIDAIIQQTAREVGATYVPPVRGKTSPDGIHQTVAGSKAYRASLERACAS